MQNNQQTKSFTTRISKLSNVLINEVTVINAVQQANLCKGLAIWDTGATCTCITKKTADQLNLTPTGLSTISGANGIAERNNYAVDIILPNNVIIQSVQVVEVNLPSGGDVLIGMDIIGLGDFTVSNFNGKTTFSFRFPSCKETDYTQEKIFPMPIKTKKIGRNDLCPCGSGQKYKFCCGLEEAA